MSRPDRRGSGIGRNLIAAVEDAARRAGASRIHWLTKEENVAARGLYDQVAERSGFIQYRKFSSEIPGMGSAVALWKCDD